MCCAIVYIHAVLLYVTWECSQCQYKIFHLFLLQCFLHTWDIHLDDSMAVMIICCIMLKTAGITPWTESAPSNSEVINHNVCEIPTAAPMVMAILKNVLLIFLLAAESSSPLVLCLSMVLNYAIFRVLWYWSRRPLQSPSGKLHVYILL